MRGLEITCSNLARGLTVPKKGIPLNERFFFYIIKSLNSRFLKEIGRWELAYYSYDIGFNSNI
jgi:hypothetical protein